MIQLVWFGLKLVFGLLRRIGFLRILLIGGAFAAGFVLGRRQKTEEPGIEVEMAEQV